MVAGPLPVRPYRLLNPVLAGSNPVVLAQLLSALAAILDRWAPARIGRRCLISASCVSRVAPCGKPGSDDPPRSYPPHVLSREATRTIKDESAARGALHLIELTLHRLHTGQLHVPERVDPGDFVVSGAPSPNPSNAHRSRWCWPTTTGIPPSRSTRCRPPGPPRASCRCFLPRRSHRTTRRR
jgi:hypothetical protein